MHTMLLQTSYELFANATTVKCNSDGSLAMKPWQTFAASCKGKKVRYWGGSI